MVIRQDYVLRLIEQLAAAFGRIFPGHSGQAVEPVEDVAEPGAALVGIEEALADVLGVRPELIDLQLPDAVAAVAPELAAEIGRALIVRARLANRVGLSDTAAASATLALAALLRAPGHHLHASGTPAADLLRELLRDDALAAPLATATIAGAWRELFEFEARMFHFALAEDALFAALELSTEPDELARRGVTFYDDVLRLPENVVRNGGLSHDEAADARAELLAGLG